MGEKEKQKVLVDSDYCWENSADIEGDVSWAVESLTDAHEGGEFPGTIAVQVVYIPE